VEIMPIVLLGGGLVLLIGGAELLVRSAAGLARSFGISSLVIGLTVVAFGTSSPELAIAIGSSLAGQPDLVVGNVVGSNIYNILLILGLAALVAPLVVEARLVRRDVPLMVGASVLVLALASDGVIGRLDGLLLVAGLAAWIGWSLVEVRRNGAGAGSPADASPAAAGLPDAGAAAGAGGVSGDPPAKLAPRVTAAARGGGRGRHAAVLLVGLGLLVVGAQALVTGAVEIATLLGLPELVVGLTIVAIGTSLPELATSLAASARGERDIAVGNVVGSNLFNLGAVLGITALVSAEGVPVPAGALTFDLPVMVAVAVACLPLFFTGHSIARWEGALLFGYALAYTTYVLLDATEHPSADRFAEAMSGVVVPLTVLTLVIVTVREIRARRNAASARAAG
jgi:cation:H+ antiporter